MADIAFLRSPGTCPSTMDTYKPSVGNLSVVVLASK